MVVEILHYLKVAAYAVATLSSSFVAVTFLARFERTKRYLLPALTTVVSFIKLFRNGKPDPDKSHDEMKKLVSLWPGKNDRPITYICRMVEEFDSLGINERAQYVWNNGEYLGSRHYYNQKVGLYALGGFFVEVFVLNDEEITRVETVKDKKILNHYLHDIDIDKLI